MRTPRQDFALGLLGLVGFNLAIWLIAFGLHTVGANWLIASGVQNVGESFAPVEYFFAVPGLVQGLWVAPLVLFIAVERRWHLVAGLVTGAAITFLLNAIGCIFMVAGKNI